MNNDLVSRRTAAQRSLAVTLSSILVCSSWGPAFAAVTSGKGAAAPSPARAAAAPALPAAAVPGAAAAVAAQAAAARPGAVAAQASLGRLAQAVPAAAHGAGASVSFSAAQSQAYDNGSAANDNAPSVAGDHTSAPPRLPLATLKPEWEASQKPSAPKLKQNANLSSVSAPVEEGSVVIVEKLKSQTVYSSSVKDTIKDVTTDEESLVYGRRERFEVAGGIRRAVQSAAGIAWIDAEGRVVVYDRTSKSLQKIEAPLGKAERLVASQDGKFLYVEAGNTISRWDVTKGEAAVVMDEKVLGGGVLELNAIRKADGSGQGLDVRTHAGHLFWTDGYFTSAASGGEEIVADSGAAPALRSAGDGLYLEDTAAGTRVWSRVMTGGSVEDLGTLPFSVRAAVYSADRKTVFALTDFGFVEWDAANARFRTFAVEKLADSLVGPASIDVSPDGRRVAIAAGSSLFFADLGSASRADEGAEAEVRAWAEANPMWIKDGVLHIGDFTFDVQTRFEQPAPEGRLARLWRRLTGAPAPARKAVPALSPKDWAAVNLPSNKKAIYQTLKAWKMGQNVLYVGETGGGKTWLIETISQLTGVKLYTVSFNEYTKNQDLLYSRKFENGKTGIELETVLKFLDDPGPAILLLDELHKPLEGIAALNNVMQSRKYHLSGRDIVGSFATHFVAGTMNPARPPYKGEPPSGELASRFGTTLNVNYLPPAEEAALLEIFHPGVDRGLTRVLVAIAKELRKVYPDVLPLPVAPRTLLNVVKHVVSYPNDDRVEIFKTTYNAEIIVPDAAVTEAIDKVLRAHALGDSKKKVR